MISEILKAYNMTGLHFEFMSDTAGCDLDLQLFYDGEIVKQGLNENNAFVDTFKVKSSLIVFGGNDISLFKGVTKTETFTVHPVGDKNARIDFDIAVTN